MAPVQMGIQESFRWIIRSVILVCGLSLTLVVLWQTAKWWGDKRTLGSASEVVCQALEGREMPQEHWKSYFSYWLLPQQPIQPYQLKSLERQLSETGYFQKIQITFEDSRLWARYRLSEPLALVGEDQLCLYEAGMIQPSLLPLEPGMIRLSGIASLNDLWDFDRVRELVSFLKLLQDQPLFKGCRVDASDWRSIKDPASELILYLEREKPLWFRVGSVHLKNPCDLVNKLVKAHMLLKSRSAQSADLRLESVIVLGYEEKK